MSIIEDLVKKNRLKVGNYSAEMYLKEFRVGERDLETAEKSLEDGNFKWAIIQAYYAIFHAARALLYKSGYREESHTSLKIAFNPVTEKSPSSKLPLLTNVRVKVGDESVDILM